MLVGDVPVLIWLFNNCTLSACLSHYNTHTHTHTISLHRQHDSIVYLNETCLLCVTKMGFLISCRSWMTALSSTVTSTRRLFCVISTARCHQADKCSSNWRESMSLNLGRMTGTDYRGRSGTRHTQPNWKPLLSLNKAPQKYPDSSFTNLALSLTC